MLAGKPLECRCRIAIGIETNFDTRSRELDSPVRRTLPYMGDKNRKTAGRRKAINVAAGLEKIVLPEIFHERGREALAEAFKRLGRKLFGKQLDQKTCRNRLRG